MLRYITLKVENLFMFLFLVFLLRNTLNRMILCRLYPKAQTMQCFVSSQDAY